MSDSVHEQFKSQLEAWAKKDGSKRPDSARLADLRTGLGKKPGDAPRMFSHIAKFVAYGDNSAHTQAVFLTASLYAMKANHTNDQKNLGHSLRDLLDKPDKPEESSMSKRLAIALDADPEDLPHHLQTLVNLVNSKGNDINWIRFFEDVKVLLGSNEDWRNAVKLRWARSYWGNLKQENDDASETSNDQTENS
jgi:CRISPR type I-E-associated protein CasB/Cse2